MYTQPRVSKHARIIFVFSIILLIWMFHLAHSALLEFQSPFDYVHRRLSRSRHSLHILNTTRWEQFNPHAPWVGGRWLNLAGFRDQDGFAWRRLQSWRKRCAMFGDKARVSYSSGKGRSRNWNMPEEFEEKEWGNVTNLLSGEWVQYTDDLAEKQTTSELLKLKEVGSIVNWTSWDMEGYAMNVTGSEGRIMLKFEETATVEMDFEVEEDVVESEDELGRIVRTGIRRQIALIREVAATMTIQDESASDSGWEMRVHGVHWPRIGVLLMTTTSKKFDGIFGLPHLSPERNHFRTSQRLLSMTIGKTLDEMQKVARISETDPWSASPSAKADAAWLAPHCEYVVYVQVHPVESAFIHRPNKIQDDMNETEKKLRCSNDATTPGMPESQMSTVIFSPDCGFILESKRPSGFLPPDRQKLICEQQEDLGGVLL